jgi:vacuolar-type H+-ATPase subunit I/STV1
MSAVARSSWKCEPCKREDPRTPTPSQAPPVVHSPIKQGAPTLEAIVALLTSLQTEVAEMGRRVNDVYERQSKELADLKSSIEKFASKFETLSEEQEKTAAKLRTVQTENKKMKMDISRIEQVLLASSVEIHGLKVRDVSEARPIIGAILNKMDCGDAVHQVEDVFVHNHIKRGSCAVIIKFVSKKTRDMVLDNKKKLIGVEARDFSCEGGKIFVNERLTTYNRHLLWLSKSTRSLGYKYVWVKNGLIHIKKDEGLNVIVVRDVEDIPSR